MDRGRQAVCAGLDPPAPRRLVSEALKALKAEHRAEARAQGRAHRVSIRVLLRDAVWAGDAMHLGRLPHRAEVWGEVLRDLAAHRTIGLAVGGGSSRACDMTAADVIALLERTRRERGTLPLFFLSDNGSPYTAEETVRTFERWRVIPILNLPHTPQHNGACERSEGDLKAEADLGEGVDLHAVVEAAVDLALARWRLDHERLRPSLGLRTAAAVDAGLPSWYGSVDRDPVWQDAGRVRAEVESRPWPTERAKKLALRRALLALAERYGVLQLERGDPNASKSSPLPPATIPTDPPIPQVPSVQPLDDRPSWGILERRSEPETARNDARRLPESESTVPVVPSSNTVPEPRGSGRNAA